MSRNIKYRGFDKIADSWVIGSPVKDKDIKGRWWIMMNEAEGVIIDNPKTIGQLVDIFNGEERYEDDKFNYEDGTYAGYLWYDTENHIWYVGDFIYGYHADEFIKIGNIHEKEVNNEA